MLAFLFALGPLALLLVLAALPPRAARAGLVAAAALGGLAWLSWPLDLPPFFSSGPMEDAFMVAALLVWTLALGLAALAQRLRPALARRGPLAYPLAVAALTALLVGGALPLVGV